ncbi:A/G-specific adenine glycosylase [Ktedonosporobacter rubrisoli]|uniref:Adenine DNA glycosylase n=1 Tax=Ktedonosporobacter rubrisoli TaxID=2509675 RepID=A0A4P6JRV5_KTERU|nr:A/G-specific adenine glycosylase [Ktedonosporobacter rubrisoli]QBD78228.1 A/G-specific adenine glycosylase [Ktedonosporobacter rubrisoli]
MSAQSLSSSSSDQPAQELVNRVHASLLQWYAVEQRDLPWRSTSDPYAILVSEIMLQQTQVDRVLPKYQQFLSAFPTLADLAAASTADVISAWVPLGYNMRAVRLQSIARQVVADYNGRLPDTIEELLKLKGIGRYTAGAIACFAYRKQVATVDTNIRRVLHRIFLGLEYPTPGANDAQMLNLAERVLPPNEAYNWNQALMDLGATICTSNNPQCPSCPLQETCQAYAEMSQHSLFPSGTVLRQIRKVAEKKPRYQSQPFKSTNRYFRGRIVDLLRSLPANQRITLNLLGPRIKPDFSADDLPWLQKIVEGLAKDGLLDYAEDGVRLP